MEIKFNGTLEDIIKEMAEFMENRNTRVVKLTSEESAQLSKLQKNESVTVVPAESEKVPEIVEPPVPVVPVVSTTYTLADLQAMAGEFVKRKKENRQILVDVLATLEVKALTQLSDSQYGLFVQKLKDVGADI